MVSDVMFCGAKKPQHFSSLFLNFFGNNSKRIKPTDNWIPSKERMQNFFLGQIYSVVYPELAVKELKFSPASPNEKYKILFLVIKIRSFLRTDRWKNLKHF